MPTPTRPYGYTHDPYVPRARSLRRDWLLAILPGVLSFNGLALFLMLSMDESLAHWIASFVFMTGGVVSGLVAYAVFAKRGHLVSGIQVAVLGLSLLVTLPAVAILAFAIYLAFK